MQLNGTIAFLFAFSFLGSIGALLVLIWAISRRQFGNSNESARTIFDPGEEGQPEEPALSKISAQQLAEVIDHGGQITHAPLSDSERARDLSARVEADQSSRLPVLLLLGSSVFWLLMASTFGLIASIKFNWPDWLNQSAWLTFGRLRPLHLNVAAYGWLSMAGMGVSLWLIPRLMRSPLQNPGAALWGTGFWNLGMIAGTLALFAGWSDGIEWLEFPWQIDILFVIAGALIATPIIQTLTVRHVNHLYVSSWYIIAAFVWFPILFLIANIPYVHFGVEHAAVNWWFAHNVLGLWLTPFGLGAAYYFIPKVLGKPIHSYQLSLIGFWSLALFYSQVGIHHLIGGPVPTWLVTLSIVTSVSMIIPVIAVAINHHMTIWGNFRTLRYSPTLRFIVLGAIMYTLTSLQGSLQSLRSINTLTHFTHFTVAHAHFGVYGFVSFILFGSIYFLMPRVVQREWPYPKLISAHFWSVLVGFGIYFIFLSIGGILQGMAMLDAQQPFMNSVTVTLPYLLARTIGGTLMTLGHLIFAYHFLALVLNWGPERHEPAQLGKQPLKGVKA